MRSAAEIPEPVHGGRHAHAQSQTGKFEVRDPAAFQVTGDLQDALGVQGIVHGIGAALRKRVYDGQGVLLDTCGRRELLRGLFPCRGPGRQPVAVVIVNGGAPEVRTDTEFLVNEIFALVDIAGDIALGLVEDHFRLGTAEQDPGTVLFGLDALGAVPPGPGLGALGQELLGGGDDGALG